MLWIYQPRAELPPGCFLSELSCATGIGLVQRARLMRWEEWFGIINNKEQRQHRGDQQLRPHPRNGMVGLFGSLVELSAMSRDGEVRHAQNAQIVFVQRFRRASIDHDSLSMQFTERKSMLLLG
jgi:hypothetical protein